MAVADIKPVGSTQLESIFTSVGRKRTERVGYYRLPANHHDGRASNWITWGDTQDAKQLNFISRGWTPLPKYGRVTGIVPGHDDPTPGSPWYQILDHRDGPGEIPPSQVQCYRWYRPEELPYPFTGTAIRFPQWEAALRGGLEVREYTCPECHSRMYFEPWHLATHLTNSHNYDRTQIIALGDKVGIDFTKSIMNIVNSTNVVKFNTDTYESEIGPMADIVGGMVTNVAPHTDLEIRVRSMEEQFSRMNDLLAMTLQRLAPSQPVEEVPFRNEVVIEAQRPRKKQHQTPEQRQAQLDRMAAAREARARNIRERMEAQEEALAHPEKVDL